MITYLSGILKFQDSNTLTVMVNDIGYGVCVASPDCYAIDEKVDFFIYSHWNQEQGYSLYGFKTSIEKQVFNLVISCSGLGPKIGLAVLASMSPQEFFDAITSNDMRALSAISGIGPKKAEFIIMHLKNKVQRLSLSSDASSNSSALKHLKQLTDALSSLNYSRNEVNSVIEYIKKEYKSSGEFDYLFRKALSFLAKKV